MLLEATSSGEREQREKERIGERGEYVRERGLTGLAPAAATLPSGIPAAAPQGRREDGEHILFCFVVNILKSVLGVAPPPVPPQPAAQLPGGGYPPTNAAGQRICRQCGMAGRYKDNKCVEKWGPGPEGPGTVCDRLALLHSFDCVFYSFSYTQMSKKDETSRTKGHH